MKYIYDLEDLTNKSIIKTNLLNSIDLSVNGSMVVSDNDKIILFDINSGNKIKNILDIKNVILVLFSIDGQYIICLDSDWIVKIYNI
jgi:WD40 repeat protein